MELDPGTAFGTGQHETTRLCLVAIERELLRDASRPHEVLDIGAGSGILAIAAALLGARGVWAMDNDADTVAIAAENARLNGVGDRIVFAAGSMNDAWPWPDRPPRACCDLLISNISSTAVVAMMPAFAQAIRPGGYSDPQRLHRARCGRGARRRARARSDPRPRRGRSGVALPRRARAAYEVVAIAGTGASSTSPGRR